MRTSIRRISYTVALLLACAYAFIALRGPQGVPALLRKRDEVRALQEQNAELEHRNRSRRERIERLRHSQAEQELEIRRELKKLRPGETTFILPEAPKPAETPAAPPAN